MLERIDLKLAERGLSDREASIMATDKPDLIRDMRRGKGVPRGDRLQALARVLGTTSDWLLSGGEHGEAEQRAELALHTVRAEVAKADNDFVLTEAGAHLPPVPLLGSAIGGDHGDLDDMAIDLVELHMGEILDYLGRPPSLQHETDAYALTVISDSMAPRFQPGERIAVTPRAPVSIGDDVVAQLRGREGDDERIKTVLVKRLARRSPSFVELHQFNPERTFRVPAGRIAAMHKVRGVLF